MASPLVLAGHGVQSCITPSPGPSPAVSLAGAALLGLSLFVGSSPEAIAQGTPAQKSADKGAQAAGQTDTVIISKMPERKGPIYSLLKKLFCKNNGSVTGAAGSEVWSVPQGQTSRISKRLEALGMTVTKLAEDWNQIFKPHQGPMTSAQQDMVDKIKSTPGMMGVQVLRIPDSALTAFAMTNERYNPTVPPEFQTPTKEQAPSTVVLPIAPDKNITLQRVKYVNDARGCIWRGIVAETGEKPRCSCAGPTATSPASSATRGASTRSRASAASCTPWWRWIPASCRPITPPSSRPPTRAPTCARMPRSRRLPRRSRRS